MASNAVSLIKSDHKKVEKLFREAVEEHHLMKVTIGELKGMKPSDPQLGVA
jgi:hypothetical protein